MGTGKFHAGGNLLMDSNPTQGGVEILLVASCYRYRDKLRPDGTLVSYADFLRIIIPIQILETFKRNYRFRPSSITLFKY